MVAGGSGPGPAVMWFRDDLRISDNPALSAAAADGRPVVALFVLDSGSSRRPPGGASRWWLHQSLAALARDLAARGVPLVLMPGTAEDAVPAVVAATGAREIHWNRRYDAPSRAVDAALKASLEAAAVRAVSHKGHLLVEPWTVRTKAGDFFRVFTPFWKAAQEHLADLPGPLPVPRLTGAPDPGIGVPLDDLGLEPRRPDWAGGLRETWTPGEAGARARLAAFLDDGLPRYADARDVPGAGATSDLSAHLRFGEISVPTVWHAVAHAAAADPRLSRTVAKFQSELGWREFSYNLLFHFPDLDRSNFQPRFDAFPWRPAADVEEAAEAWRRGRTGYPIVDAGMRQLWATGTMHNRVRMIVASFLVKHLLVDWRVGEAWFWDTLCDADPANNPASWQWTAGSGADAAPYFRIFNPVSQGEKFDPDGAYVRRWVPELSGLPDDLLHKPWTATADRLRNHSVVLSRTYPRPVVDHDAARRRALAAFEALKTDAA
jgi:deoxyribodipyrimidine photo-lyase